MCSIIDMIKSVLMHYLSILFFQLILLTIPPCIFQLLNFNATGATPAELSKELHLYLWKSKVAADSSNMSS